MALSRKYRAAIESLTRIRAGETFEAEGLKRVWHQTSCGADLLSHVNEEGRLVRQEFTLFEDYFLWKAGEGLQTGGIREDGGSAAARASDRVDLDPAVDQGRIQRACEALSLYEGPDRYLRHLERLLRSCGRVDAEVVTHVTRPPVKPPSVCPRPRPHRRWPVLLGAATALLVGAGAAVWMLVCG